MRLKSIGGSVDSGGVGNLRKLLSVRKLLGGTTAILLCACGGVAVDTAAAQSPTPARSATTAQSPTPAHTATPPRAATPARIATSGAVKRGQGRRACRASHRRRQGRGRSGCRSHAARNHGVKHVARRSHANSNAGQTVLVSAKSAESRATVLASVLATACQNTEVTPEEGNLEAIDAATVCLVNQERARNGELPLRVNAELEAAAQGHSEEMVSENYFAHVAPSGLTPVGRVQSTGYIPNPRVGYTLGENIAWGTLQLSTPSAIVAAWIASPEHLENILYGAYLDTAIGVAPAAPASLGDGQPGAVYTQEFGVIVH